MHGTTCPFCLEFDDVELSEFRMLFRGDVLSSRIIAATSNFVAIAGLGAMRPGYVLILPKEHMLSFAFLHQAEAEEAEQFKAELMSIMKRFYTDLIVFEHGPVSDEASSGGCIDHAHLHIIPSAVDLFPHLAQEFCYHSVHSISELAYFRQIRQHYIYYEKGQQGFSFEIDHHIPSQYIRRLLWKMEGQPDEWDWGVFTGYEHVIHTVNVLSSVYEQCQVKGDR